MNLKLRSVLLTIGILLCVAVTFTEIPVTAAEDLGTASITDFDVFDADIRDVLRGLAELGDINILFDPAVKGTITIKLKHGLTIKDAIELISQTNGYFFRWVPESRTVIIGSAKTFESFKILETRVYQLRYADVMDVALGLTVIVEAKYISVDPRTSQLTVNASVLQHQNIEEVIKRLDREVPQINIEARVVEVKRSASRDLGLTYGFEVGNSDQQFRVTTTAALTALEKENKARMLANPNISTTDNQEGKIFIGEKYPIVSTSTTEGTTTTSVTYVEFGTSLSIIPRVNDNNTVTVQVKAFVSSAPTWFASGGMSVPKIITREASSVVRLREGETFVMSGLNFKASTLDQQGVPGLSKIPIIGRLFTNRNEKPYDDSEICIFLTPKIIRPTPNQTATTTTNNTSVTLNASQYEQPETPKEQPPVVTTTEPVKEATSQVIETTPTVTTTPTTTTATTPPVTTPPSEPTAGTEVNSSTPPTTTTTEPTTAPVVTPTETGTPPVTEPTAPAGPEPMVGLKVTLKVKAGDTINLIAKKYGISSSSILEENKIKAQDTLQVGQALVLPIPKDHLYTIKAKETLWRIAKRYGTTVTILQEINQVTDVTKLRVGQVIILPVAVDQIVDKKY